MSSEIPINTSSTQDPSGKADSSAAAVATTTSTTTTPQPMVLLQKYCRSSSTELSKTTSLSEDGKTLTFHGDGGSEDKKQSLGERCEVDAQATYDLSSITTKNNIDTFYPLSSYYLLCLHPLDLLTYRKACEKANNSTPIKITDKKIVLRALLGEEKFESSQQQQSGSNNNKSKSSEKDESTNKERSKTSPVKKGSSSSKEKHRSSSTSGSKHHHDKHKHHSKESSSSKHHSSSSSKDHSKHHHKDKEKHRHSHGGTSSSKKGDESNKKTASSASKKDNKPSGPVTSEQVLENLRLVADKRSDKTTDVSKPKPSEGEQTAEGSTEKMDVEGDGKEKEPKKDGEGEEKKDEEMDDAAKAEREREKLHSMLSQRIQVTVEQLEEDRERTKQIVANEIPVGNSFSVLRAPGRDLSKVLDILNEVKQKEAAALKAEILSSKSSKDGSGVKRKSSDITNSSGKASGVAGVGGDNKRAKEPKGNPIIIVPNAMTSPITMINAQMFFNDKHFMSRQDVLKQKGSSARFMGPCVSFTRKISSKYTGGLTSNDLEYEIMDNPLKLKSRSDWDRIVAVVAQGASWQFKGWPGSWSNPVDIFSRTMGFYIGMEGTPLPKELQGWNVKTLMISREKRIMDGVVHSHFFSALDEWMAIRKPEYLAVSENS